MFLGTDAFSTHFSIVGSDCSGRTGGTIWTVFARPSRLAQRSGEIRRRSASERIPSRGSRHRFASGGAVSLGQGNRDTCLLHAPRRAAQSVRSDRQAFEAGIRAATASADAQHEMVLRWLHATGRIMVTNSLWWATRTVNSHTSNFVRSLTRRAHQPMFELLPPQRAALLEQGLLDQAKTAIVVDMPTSGGKTLLAQFRILQALNQFNANNGWIAYVAPTRALSAQITRRLRQDFAPIGLRVEQLTAAVEVDAFEEQFLSDREQFFHILVSTRKNSRWSSATRKSIGLWRSWLWMKPITWKPRVEECASSCCLPQSSAIVHGRISSYLCLMSRKPKPLRVGWRRTSTPGRRSALSTTPWKPNERIIGLYRANADSSQRAGWHLTYETLTATKKAMPLHGTHRVGGVKPIDVPKSQVLTGGKQKGLGLQTAAIASVMAVRGTASRLRTTLSLSGKWPVRPHGACLPSTRYQAGSA